MHHLSNPPKGALQSWQQDMPSLASNKIGETNTRSVTVWTPHNMKAEGLPLLVCLAPYLSTGPGQIGWRNFGETIPERLDRMIEEGVLKPCAVAFIDSFNRLGGNQFINTPVIGNWTDALADDLVPAIEAKFGCGGKGRRGLFGHSSGGYGAFANLALRPDTWAAAASHAGDCGFDWVYKPTLPDLLRALEPVNFNIETFITQFWQSEKPKGAHINPLMLLAMAASYDPSEAPDDHWGIRLPVTTDTCEIIEEHWHNWQYWDMAAIAERGNDALKEAKAIYIDCGRQDEYNMIYGTRLLSHQLHNTNISHRFEEFQGGHGTIGPRYEVSLPFLIEALL